MQTCAETVNWGPDHSLWSLEDPSRMGTAWQFPVWIIMFCFLNVSHALSISMVIISTLRPTLKCKWWYMLLNSCYAPPWNPLFSRSDARVGELCHLVEPGKWGTPVVESELPLLCKLFQKFSRMKSLKCVGDLTLRKIRDKYMSVESRRESLNAGK